MMGFVKYISIQLWQ